MNDGIGAEHEIETVGSVWLIFVVGSLVGGGVMYTLTTTLLPMVAPSPLIAVTMALVVGIATGVALAYPPTIRRFLLGIIRIIL